MSPNGAGHRPTEEVQLTEEPQYTISPSKTSTAPKIEDQFTQEKSGQKGMFNIKMSQEGLPSQTYESSAEKSEMAAPRFEENAPIYHGERVVMDEDCRRQLPPALKKKSPSK